MTKITKNQFWLIAMWLVLVVIMFATERTF